MLPGQFMLMFKKFKLLNNTIILKLNQINKYIYTQQACKTCEQQ